MRKTTPGQGDVRLADRQYADPGRPHFDGFNNVASVDEQAYRKSAWDIARANVMKGAKTKSPMLDRSPESPMMEASPGANYMPNLEDRYRARKEVVAKRNQALISDMAKRRSKKQK